MKHLSLIAIVLAAISFTGCTASTDGRTGLRGELCAFGYCLAPQAMSAAAQPVPQTAILSGAVVAPATVVSQPAFASAPAVAVQSFGAAACAPVPAPQAPPQYIPPRSYPIEK